MGNTALEGHVAEASAGGGASTGPGVASGAASASSAKPGAAAPAVDGDAIAQAVLAAARSRRRTRRGGTSSGSGGAAAASGTGSGGDNGHKPTRQRTSDADAPAGRRGHSAESAGERQRRMPAQLAAADAASKALAARAQSDARPAPASASEPSDAGSSTDARRRARDGHKPRATAAASSPIRDARHGSGAHSTPKSPTSPPMITRGHGVAAAGAGAAPFLKPPRPTASPPALPAHRSADDAHAAAAGGAAPEVPGAQYGHAPRTPPPLLAARGGVDGAAGVRVPIGGTGGTAAGYGYAAAARGRAPSASPSASPPASPSRGRTPPAPITLEEANAHVASRGYRLVECVGKGGFGRVYHATFRGDNDTTNDVAIKMIDIAQMTKLRMVERTENEVRVHSSLDHPCVVKVLESFSDAAYMCMVMEYCPGGDLYHYIRPRAGERVEVHIDVVRRFTAQLVQGISYLHSENVMHRDLKLSNLLLTKHMQLKIGDFGLAVRCEDDDEEHFTMCGTPNYIAPEVAAGADSSHNKSADLWSVGCLLHTLLVGNPPKRATVTASMRRSVGSMGVPPSPGTPGGGRPGSPADSLPGDGEFDVDLSRLSTTAPPDAVDLIKRLLQHDPALRPTASAVLRHPFLAAVSDSALATADRFDQRPGTIGAAAVSRGAPLSLAAAPPARGVAVPRAARGAGAPAPVHADNARPGKGDGDRDDNEYDDDDDDLEDDADSVGLLMCVPSMVALPPVAETSRHALLLAKAAMSPPTMATRTAPRAGKSAFPSAELAAAQAALAASQSLMPPTVVLPVELPSMAEEGSAVSASGVGGTTGATGRDVPQSSRASELTAAAVTATEMSVPHSVTATASVSDVCVGAGAHPAGPYPSREARRGGARAVHRRYGLAADPDGLVSASRSGRGGVMLDATLPEDGTWVSAATRDTRDTLPHSLASGRGRRRHHHGRGGRRYRSLSASSESSLETVSDGDTSYSPSRGDIERQYELDRDLSRMWKQSRERRRLGSHSDGDVDGGDAHGHGHGARRGVHGTAGEAPGSRHERRARDGAMGGVADVSESWDMRWSQASMSRSHSHSHSHSHSQLSARQSSLTQSLTQPSFREDERGGPSHGHRHHGRHHGRQVSEPRSRLTRSTASVSASATSLSRPQSVLSGGDGYPQSRSRRHGRHDRLSASVDTLSSSVLSGAARARREQRVRRSRTHDRDGGRHRHDGDQGRGNRHHSRHGEGSSRRSRGNGYKSSRRGKRERDHRHSRDVLSASMTSSLTSASGLHRERTDTILWQSPKGAASRRHRYADSGATHPTQGGADVRGDAAAQAPHALGPELSPDEAPTPRARAPRPQPQVTRLTPAEAAQFRDADGLLRVRGDGDMEAGARAVLAAYSFSAVAPAAGQHHYYQDDDALSRSVGSSNPRTPPAVRPRGATAAGGIGAAPTFGGGASPHEYAAQATPESVVAGGGGASSAGAHTDASVLSLERPLSAEHTLASGAPSQLTHRHGPTPNTALAPVSGPSRGLDGAFDRASQRSTPEPGARDSLVGVSPHDGADAADTGRYPGSALTPVNSQRLRPISHRTPAGSVVVREDGEVRVTFRASATELRITSHGRRIRIVQLTGVAADEQAGPAASAKPTEGTQAGNGDADGSASLGGAVTEYTLRELPEAFHGMYRYAAQVVGVIRANSRNPRVVLLHPDSKCALMDNGPKPDFEMRVRGGWRVMLSLQRQQVDITTPEAPKTTYALSGGYHSDQAKASVGGKVQPPVSAAGPVPDSLLPLLSIAHERLAMCLAENQRAKPSAPSPIVVRGTDKVAHILRDAAGSHATAGVGGQARRDVDTEDSSGSRSVTPTPDKAPPTPAPAPVASGVRTSLGGRFAAVANTGGVAHPVAGLPPLPPSTPHSVSAAELQQLPGVSAAVIGVSPIPYAADDGDSEGDLGSGRGRAGASPAWLQSPPHSPSNDVLAEADVRASPRTVTQHTPAAALHPAAPEAPEAAAARKPPAATSAARDGHVSGSRDGAAGSAQALSFLRSDERSRLDRLLDPSRVQIKGLGWACQMPSGELLVHFEDGARLVIDPRGACVTYLHPDTGLEERYEGPADAAQALVVPPHVRKRLGVARTFTRLLSPRASVGSTKAPAV